MTLPDHSARVRLSPAQRDLLATLAGYDHGEGKVNPVGQRTADVLRRHKLIEWSGGGGWVKVTSAGYAALDEHSAKEADDGNR